MNEKQILLPDGIALAQRTHFPCNVKEATAAGILAQRLLLLH